MRITRAVELIESQAAHLSSPDPLVRETAREAVRHVLASYAAAADAYLYPQAAQDTPEVIAARRAALPALYRR